MLSKIFGWWRFGLMIGALAFALLIPESEVAAVLTDNELRPKKRALLVGVSKYRRTGTAAEWIDLNTGYELELLSKILVDKFRFEPADIVVLKDETATKANILSEWRKLVDGSEKGDYVFIHFSGHGDSIPDDNKDEIDGRDEALVPFDYVSKNDFSNHLRDDEINLELEKLKARQPGGVLISFDSCFSGSATRTNSVVRGGSRDFDKPENESPSGLNEPNVNYPSNYVFLAAARPDQKAYETYFENTGKRIGVYSAALIKALSQSGPQTSYRDLFERINDHVTRVRRDQNPQFEGNLDALALDGSAIEQTIFAGVRAMAKGETKKAILEKGRLHGVTVGSRYAIYPPGTQNPYSGKNRLLAMGTVIETDAATSVLQLNDLIVDQVLKNARAFETEHFYGDMSLKILVDDLRSLKRGAQIYSALVDPQRNRERGFEAAQFFGAVPSEKSSSPSFDVRIYSAPPREKSAPQVPPGFSGLVLERVDGSVLALIRDDARAVDEVNSALEREYRLRLVKGLQDYTDPRLDVRIRIIPVSIEFGTNGGIRRALPKKDFVIKAGAETELKVGEYVMLELENKGMLDAYVTVLNLRSDGRIGSAFPHVRLGRVDNLIKKGQKILIPLPYVFRITEPMGEESFRAVATDAPTDFTALIDESLRSSTSDQRQINAAQSPLGRLLSAAQSGKRSGFTQGAPVAWSISSFTFTVVR